METGSFFKDLFDFDFKSFVALKFIKIIFMIGTILIGLAALAGIISYISQGGSGIFIGLVVVPVVALLYLIFLRVWLEVIAMLFRIGDNTAKMVELLGGQARSTDPTPGV
ncbi:MAG: DUF4282 domain-containing protein [Acidimicrobiia bacterium]